MGKSRGERSMNGRASKQQAVVQQLRRRIVSGRMKPGERLPTRVELEQRFRASTVTVQRALDSLAADGFVYAEGRRGTFVAERPPNLYRYGLVFPHPDTPERPWSRFWTALAREAAQMRQTDPAGRELVTYCVDDGVRPAAADVAADQQRLLADIRAHRLAGVIFAHPLHVWAQGPDVAAEIQHAGMGCVSIGSRSRGVSVANVGMRTDHLIGRALDYLAERKRRRIAVITIAASAATRAYVESIHAAVKQRGMELQPYWLLGVDLNYPATAASIAQLLMHGDQRVRPDGLFIADDNLVEHTAVGLVEAGVRVPKDLAVVGHCNFPWPTPTVLPMRRLGYDVREVLLACLDVMQRQRAGKRVPDETIIAPRFEDEVVMADAVPDAYELGLSA